MKRLTLPLFTASFLFSEMALAQTVDTQYDEQQVDIQSKTQSNNLEPVAEAPDTFALWYYIQQKDLVLAQQEFARLTKRHPYWLPDKDLLNAIASLTTVKVRKPVVTPKPIVKKRDLSVFERMSSGGEAYWRSMPLKQLQQASERAFQERKLAHHALLGWAFISRELYTQSLRHFTYLSEHQEFQKSTADGIRQSILGLVAQAVDKGDKQGLAELIATYPQQPIKEHIEFHAWQDYQNMKYEPALGWFRFTDNYYSQVLSLKQLGREDEAVALACQHISITNLLNYCVSAYSEKQLALYEQESYQASLDMAEKIRRFQSLNTDQLQISAWSHFHLGHNQQSVQAFSELIQRQPKNKSYAAILVDLLKEDRQALAELASSYPTIEQELNSKQQSLAWSRKQFNRFYRSKSRDVQDSQFLLEAGIHWRSQEANDPLADFNSQHHFIGLARDWQQYRFGARFNYHKTHSHSPSIGDAFGMGQLDGTYGGLTGTSELGLSAYLKKQNEGSNLLAEMSYWRPQHSLRSVLTGKLSGVWFMNNTTLAMTIFRERLKQSTLSLHGLFTDESARWGSVTANGIKGLAAYALSPQWNVSAELAGAALRGENVKNNYKWNASLALTHNVIDMYPEYLDYFRLGPYLSWAHYQRNLNAFTFGNGGYFSPDLLLSVGGRAEVLTLEDKTWQLKGKVDLGYLISKPKDITIFPYDEDEQRLKQQDEHGLGLGLELEGQWLFYSKWELVGQIKHNYSDTYSELNIGLHVRWNYSDRSGETSDGLISSSSYQADYPWY